MGRLIDRYLKEMHGEQVRKAPQKDEIKPSVDRFASYRQAQKDKDVLEVPFAFADPDGNLVYTDANGVSIVLLEEDFKKSIDYYDASIKDRFVGKPLVTVISKISEEEGRVYVQSARNNQRTTRSQLIREINAELSGGNQPAVCGKVVRVSNRSLTVDIFGRGIMGVCPVGNWSVNYTRYLTEQVKRGELVDFNVTGQLPKVKGKELCFSLDHKPYTEDAWDSIPEELLQEGSVVVVKCIDKPDGKSFWWGVSPMLKGIEIMGDFTKRVDVMVSLPYKCRVDKIDKEKKFFRVVPFELADVDPATAQAVNFIRQTRNRGKNS